MLERMRELARSCRERGLALCRTEVALLAAPLVVVGGVWAFAELADEVVEGETARWDGAVLGALRRGGEPIGPSWLAEGALEVTALGSNAVLGLTTLVVAGYLLLRRLRRETAYLLLAIVGGLVVSTILKYAFGRERPEAALHLAPTRTPSFPSGHSMLAAVVWLTLGSMLARLHERRRVKAYIVGVALLVTLLVGSSRVYLGVHFPSDVLAGWTVGLVWATLVWAVARWLQVRGEMREADGGEG